MTISYTEFKSLESFSNYRSGFKLLNNMRLLPSTVTSCCWSPIVWKNNYALTANFLSSSFLVLDFDTPGDETMEEINHALQDHRRIIATTKSHQQPKNGIVCDRFRLIIPFTETITSYAVYRQTYLTALKRFPWADRSCLDGARFFYPCKEIKFIDTTSDYRWDVDHTLPPPSAEIQISTVTKGIIPNWCLDVINNSRILDGSRNVTVFRVALALFEAGFLEDKIRKFILRMNIDFSGANIESAIQSAKKKWSEKNGVT